MGNDVLKKKERVAMWDNMKAILIFLVVLGHFSTLYDSNSNILKTICFIIYLFHMPAFIFVSGLFSKKIVLEKKYEKVIDFAILYVVIKLLLFGCSTIIHGKVQGFSLFTTPGLPWYVFALAAYYLLTIWLQKLEFTYLFILSVILACVVGYDNSIGAFLMVSRIVVFYPFFLMGYHMDQNKIIEKTNNVFMKILSGAFFLGLIAVSFVYINKLRWLMPLFTGQNPYSTLNNFNNYGGLIRAFYFLIVFVVIYMFIHIVPKKRLWITVIGERSLQIYVFHYLSIYLLCDQLKIDQWMNKKVPALGYKWILIVSIVVTLFFSLKVWGIILSKFLSVKWKRNDME